MDKWLFQKWCQEVDVEEVLTATLPNEHSHFQQAYSKHHPERNNPFGGGRLVDGQGYRVLVEPRALPHGN